MTGTERGRTVALLALAALLVLAGVGLWQAGTSGSAAGPQVRAERLGDRLRCPTCQGLSVADSPSKVAGSMRELIAEQIAAGRSDQEIESFFTDRYGDWVLLSPASRGLGWLVWVLPVGLVMAGGVAAGTRLRRGRQDPLSETERARALQELHRWRTESGDVASERLDAALQLLADVDEGGGGREARDLAMRRVLAASDGHTEAATQQPTAAAPAPPPARSGLRWVAGGGVFVAALVVLLAVVVQEREPGETLTGSLPTEASGERPDVDDLRAQVEQDPQDPALRLELGDALAAQGDLPGAAEAWQTALAASDDVGVQVAAASRMLQAGVPGLARRAAEQVAEANPEEPDAVLLLGVAQAQVGDQQADATLRRFLDFAPGDHPGRELAERLAAETGDGG